MINVHNFNWFRSIETNWINSKAFLLLFLRCVAICAFMFFDHYASPCVYVRAVSVYYRSSSTLVFAWLSPHVIRVQQTIVSQQIDVTTHTHTRIKWVNLCLFCGFKRNRKQKEYIHGISNARHTMELYNALRQSTQYQNSMAGTTFSNLFLDFDNNNFMFFFFLSLLFLWSRFPTVLCFYLSDAQFVSVCVSWGISLTLNCVSALAMCALFD